MKFNHTDSTKVLSFTDLIKETKLRNETRISIDLDDQTLTDSAAVNIFSTDVNINITNMRLYWSQCSNQFIQQIAYNQLSTFHHLCLAEFPYENRIRILTRLLSKDTPFKYHTFMFVVKRVWWNKLSCIYPALSNATQLKGPYLHYIPNKYKQQVIHALPILSQLQEIRFDTYSLLPHITHLSQISFLSITNSRGESTDLSHHLIQLIHRNQHTIRVLNLWRLQSIGFRSWDGFLNALSFCVDLVRIELYDILQLDGVTQWNTTVGKLHSLVQLEFNHVELFDTGLKSVCEGLIAHPAIKNLYVNSCQQTSKSCEALTNLIHTISYLERLEVNKLHEPDTEPIKVLKQTAEEYLIKTEFNE